MCMLTTIGFLGEYAVLGVAGLLRLLRGFEVFGVGGPAAFRRSREEVLAFFPADHGIPRHLVGIRGPQF